MKSQKPSQGIATQTTLAARLQALRKARGLSRAKLASQVGVSIPCVWGWEAGSRKPRDRYLKALADALDVSTDTLRCGGNPSLLTYVSEARTKLAQIADVDPDKVIILIER